jgi:hypothetical protein
VRARDDAKEKSNGHATAPVHKAWQNCQHYFKLMIKQLIESADSAHVRIAEVSRITRGTLQTTDISAALDEAFILYSDHSLRAACMHTIAAVVSEGSLSFIEGRLLSFVDQLPAALSTLSCAEEAEAYVDLLSTLCSANHEAIRLRLEKSVPKVDGLKFRFLFSLTYALFQIVSVALNALSGPSLSTYPLLVIKTLLSVPHRLVPVSVCTSIRAPCLRLLSDPQLYCQAAECVALLAAADSAESWGGACRNHSAVLVKALSMLGMWTEACPAVSSEGIDAAARLSGPEKAIACERLFRGTCAALAQVTHPHATLLAVT